MSSEPVKVGRLATDADRRDAIHVAVVPVVAAEDVMPGEAVSLTRDEYRQATLLNPGNRVGIVDPFLTEGVKQGQRFWLFLYPNTVTGMRHHWQHPSFPDEKKPLKMISGGAPADWELICQEMRQSDDYSSMPVLADALEDAGRTEEAGICREITDPTNAQRQVCLLLGGELAEAVEWMDNYASRFIRAIAYDYEEDESDTDPEDYESIMTYHKIMEGANEYLESQSKGGFRPHVHLNFDTPDFVYQEKDKFWKAYQVITGKKLDKEETLGNIFSCSC